MTDDKSKRGPADRDRINVNEERELRYWCHKFGCTEGELRAAVKARGVIAKDVEAYLRRQGLA